MKKYKTSSVTSNFNNISKKDGIIYKIIFPASLKASDSFINRLLT